ncbi:hypothetical protein F3087_01905 [Nocardia colli]|uniref:Uncharacterized protein n=1 Tax=Nocardia colli TaxID=2545717 RepID=A0A5N0EP47_9NOCA|nr:hypothetical protein [Nocardia colli]KAA8890094.1 hypothetical protein F3087_01905 [Nocardia colli]
MASSLFNDWDRFMKKLVRAGAVLGFTLLAMISVDATASAGTVTYVHNGAFRYMDPDVTTTINFSPGHPFYRVLIWSENVNPGYLNNTVRMYQGATQVWSASGQKNRVYDVGSNVSRIVVSRDCGCTGRNGVMPGNG